MTYEEALAYIHGRSRFRIKLGLARMHYLLNRLGDPHRQYPVVHIAGTNGKGSTTAMLATVLKKAGYKVGRFTSPHLSSYCERIVVNEQKIAPENLASLVQQVKPVVEAAAEKPEIGAATEFELGALLAFVYFAGERVDLAVVEVGMGGRLDATNVVSPLAVGITSIAMEHREYLGDTLESIAWEKAGVIKPERPVVIGPQPSGITEVFVRRAAKTGSPLYCVGKEINFQLVKADLTGTYLNLQWEKEPAFSVRINLFGSHQAVNAALVYGLLVLLRREGFSWRFADLTEGFNHVKWPGRLELIPGNPAFLLDGAHNPEGCAALVKSLEELFPGKTVNALVGILNNRPVEEMAGILAPKLGKVIATRVPDPKTASPSRIAAAFRRRGIATVEIPDPLQAYEAALRAADSPVLLTGSLYLLGALRPSLTRESR